MRILMLAYRIPYPPHTGDKVRAYPIARHLAQRHELTLDFVTEPRRDEHFLVEDEPAHFAVPRP
jgi:hypothetical protein